MGSDPDFHFAAFSFVDRITEFVPGERARGRYAVPARIAAFPACLVAEAVGQLAAWVSMDAVGFRGRPVAALAGETRFLAPVAPGSTLELAADITPARIAWVSFEAQRELCAADARHDISDYLESAVDAGTTVRALLAAAARRPARVDEVASLLGIRALMERGIRFLSSGEARRTSRPSQRTTRSESRIQAIDTRR